MDLTQTIVAKSDQLNADDLFGGAQTFTVAEVRRGDSDQPVSIVLAELGDKRPFKPSKTVIRLLVHAWGKETDEWPENARMTLYRNESVKWAGQEVGGIRVSHLSHIGKQLKVALAESKSKKSLHVVDPLPDAPPPAPSDAITPEQLSRLGKALTSLSMNKGSALAFYETTTGRVVDSSKALTKDEASAVIDGLEALAGASS